VQHSIMSRRHVLTMLSAVSATSCSVRTGNKILAPGTPLVPTPAAKQMARGAGATFPDLVYQDWIAQYANGTPNSKLSYDPVGSEDGVRNFLRGRLDFAGCDSRLTPNEEDTVMPSGASRRPHLYIPTVVGAVAPIYRFVDSTPLLQFSPEVLAAIFQGDVRRWDDPAISGENPGIRLPKSEINVVRRDDGSGTTYALTSFFKVRRTTWRLGTGLRIKWPSFTMPATHSTGVADLVASTPNAIGYVEFSYAADLRGLRFGKVRNLKEQPVLAGIDSVNKALPKSLPQDPADIAHKIFETNEEDAYPIVSLTWLLVPVRPDARSAELLKDFLSWAVGPDGRNRVKLLDYVPLNEPLTELALAQIDKIQAGSSGANG
jgi:phosphate transport system substrate-binding protein